LERCAFESARQLRFDLARKCSGGFASFVWVQCKFDFSVGWHKRQKTNSQRIFRVPDSAAAQAMQLTRAGVQPE
jgi:hypothetical protein